MEGKLEFARRVVGYRVSADARTPLRVTAEATLGTEALDRAVRVELGKRYWWKVGAFVRSPTESFTISASGSRRPVYVYGTRLSHEQKGMIVKAMSLAVGGARDGQALRRLIAIAVVAGGRHFRNVPMDENGVPIACYGTAFIDASDLVDDDYHPNLRVPYGICAVLHELAHAVFEPDLVAAWEEGSGYLGWKTADRRHLLRLPDGTLTDRYNERPWDAPTELASRTEYDDRAESVTFALSGGMSMLGRRADLVSTALRPKPNKARVSIEATEAYMPEIPDLVEVRLAETVPLSSWAVQAKVEDYAGYVKRNRISSLGVAPK